LTVIPHTAEIEEIMAHLLAEIRTGQELLKEEMLVTLEASQGKMDANQTKTDANLEEMEEDMKFTKRK
jgi:hypothetical protein